MVAGPLKQEAHRTDVLLLRDEQAFKTQTLELLVQTEGGNERLVVAGLIQAVDDVFAPIEQVTGG